MKDGISDNWPSIPFADWQPTAAALHLYLQIVGKYRLARSPWINHSWHATHYLTPQGLTTGMIADGDGGIEVSFDFVRNVLQATCGDGRSLEFGLQPMTVAEFHEQFIEMLAKLGRTTTFHGSPNELPERIAFAQDDARRPWDTDAVARFHRALLSSHHVLQHFRTAFRGKVSPVHLFWGSFDLAVTRFSGRRAPLHPGGIPHLPDDVTQEAYSHEVSSAGFWAGGGAIDAAAFYSYAYPTPDGFAQAPVLPEAAYFDREFGEFILPYAAVRESADPEATLLIFLESTYEAAASLGHWNRELECAGGLLGQPPPIDC